MYQYSLGDNRAFEQLYTKHKGALYRYFLRQIGDKQLAEDLYQETWGRVIKAAANYQSSAKFTTWLYRIAHNLLIDHVRALKPVASFTDLCGDEADIESLLPSDLLSMDEIAMQNLKASILKQCIALLPHVQKEAFLLSMEMGFTAAAISEIADVGLEATKSRLRYANHALKECVNSKWQE
jgi:RNA polymerase sigma-70 factor (ECF subfamily)